MPFLNTIRTDGNFADVGKYPFNIPAFSQGVNLEFTANVTFFVGENGSGKSTLLEAIAENCGFNPSGGNRGLVGVQFQGSQPYQVVESVNRNQFAHIISRD